MTISKRTFFEGCHIELFRRNDGGNRIKFTTPNGDEVTLNLDTKGWAKGDPNFIFERLAYPEEPEGFDGVGSKLPHNVALWSVLINCDHYIKNVVQQLGVNLNKTYGDGEQSAVPAEPQFEVGGKKGSVPKVKPKK